MAGANNGASYGEYGGYGEYGEYAGDSFETVCGGGVTATGVCIVLGWL
jgi:hypothetical protein